MLKGLQLPAGLGTPSEQLKRHSYFVACLTLMRMGQWMDQWRISPGLLHSRLAKYYKTIELFTEDF